MAKQTSSYATSARPENDLRMQKRAVSAAWWGLAMQALLAVVAIVLGLVGSSGGWTDPLFSVVMFAALGLFAWLAILAATAFRRAKALEDYELEAARRSGESERTIFATEADARPAARRLRRVYKWGLPASAAILGLLLALHGLWGLNQSLSGDNYILQKARYLAGLFAGFAFVGFVLGRYLLGMSTQPAWSLLRGGATYLIGTVYLFALMAFAAGAAALGWNAANAVVRFVVPGFALLVGIELLLNIVLDLYRPKSAEETPRPAFDSRLLALLASPGDIVQSLNEAVNYQFGFEITRSWFWRLLSRSFAWLLLFGVLVLVLLSSIVIVEPHEKALLTSLGRLHEQPLEPGITLKLPWPLAMVDKYPVTRIEEMIVGSHENVDEGTALLWSNEHTHDEVLMVVAGGSMAGDFGDTTIIRARPGGGGSGHGPMPPAQLGGVPEMFVQQGAAPPVALAAVEVVVQWKIDEQRLVKFATRAERPDQRLRQLANAAVTRQMLRYDIDAVIGVERPRIAGAIEQALRQAVQDEDLGIQIVSVGVASAHPPQNVAEDFNNTAAMTQHGKQLKEQGLQQQMRILTASAGSVAAAQQIIAEHQRFEALRAEYQQLRRVRDAGQATEQQAQDALSALNTQQAELERLIQQAGGQAGRALLAARGQRWGEENRAVAQAALQPVEYAAYQQAPRYYAFRRYLEILAQAMPDKRKFMLLTDDKNPEIQLDFTEAITALSNLTIPPRAGEGRE